MREEASAADQDEPRRGGRIGQGNVAIVAREDKAKDGLHGCQVEEDAGDRLGAGQAAGKDCGESEADGRQGRGDYPDVEALGAWPCHNQDAGKAHHGGDHARLADRLGQKDRRKQDDPDGRGELKRKDLRQRDHGDGKEPQVLAREMREVAAEVQAKIAPRHLAPFAGAEGDRANDQDADQAAVEHDLEGIERKADRPPSNRHRRERGNRAGHPDSRTQGGGQISLL